MKHPLSPLAGSFFLLCTTLLAVDAPVYTPDFTPQPPVKVLSPEEELKTIQLPPGYSLELVLSERDGIREPVNITFDGNGRMYVIEMRSYMQDIDATGEHEPIGVVSRHESTKRDGQFDKHSIFADKLLLPREVLPLDDRVLINVTDTLDITSYQDTNGDGVADKKEVVYQAGPRGGNLEHQQSGLIWNLDNWIYQSTANVRLRFNGQKMVEEKIPSGGGQWGLAHDDYGKVWFSNAGAEKGLWHFQTPALYGAYDAPGQFPPDFLEVWPLVGLADFQGGASRVRVPEKTLNHFTASCGQEVFRGDRLPADLRGDVLISEPVGRLIRRAKVAVKDGITTLSNAYDKTEFIRSTDPNFRIVNMTTGPDGCLYLVDMYRGIIQEGNWTREGSYLRKVIQQYGMEKVVSHGRVWRLVYKDFKPGPQPQMLAEKPAQWIAHLSHPNGWWRDTAQKLLVLKGDKSVVPALQQLARTSSNQLARVQAIWTLEGLEALDRPLIAELLKDKDTQIRMTGIRVSEGLLKQKDALLEAQVRSLINDADPSVQIQVLNTAKYVGWPDFSKFAQTAMLASTSKGFRNLGSIVLTGNDTVGGREFKADEIAVLQKGQDIYRELCFSCHGFDGKGMPMDGPKVGMTIAPPLSLSKDVRSHRDAVGYVLLNGMSGPIEGKTYDAQMVSMASNDDAWIAAVGSYVRNAFGNHGALLTTNDVARLRMETKSVTTPWTSESLATVLPRPLGNANNWKITASDNADGLDKITDGKIETKWESKVDQASGQWIQVEFPQLSLVTGLRMDNSRSAGSYPRGYKVQSSTDGVKWSSPIVEGHGLQAITEANFTPVATKFLRITLTAAQKSQDWEMSELTIFQPPASSGAKVTSR